MRIVVSSDNDKALDSSVSHHFGRCPYFTVINIEDDEILNAEAVENPYFSAHSPGQVPDFVSSLGADVMIAGGMGGRAISIFSNYGIKCSTGGTGSVKKAVTHFLSGYLSDASPCRESREHGHGTSEYEKGPVDRLKEEAEYLLNKLDDIISPHSEKNN
ncbi:MAG: NifB/NifX family molybdenum-iron cluster-binding protein [Candidatus Aegiribacteria sp.]|nr:NifB/NifX family molybdenum-iron cluster-binding protein [Candidatus Aegiribacteria sp.]